MTRLATSYPDFIRNHYNLGHSQVNEVYDVMVGDRLAVWNATKKTEELMEVSEKMYLTGILECFPLGKKDAICLFPKDHTIFKIPKPGKFFGQAVCECGSKYNTGFENHHLYYCPLYKRNDR